MTLIKTENVSFLVAQWVTVSAMAWVIAVTWVWNVAQEFPHVVDTAKKVWLDPGMKQRQWWILIL